MEEIFKLEYELLQLFKIKKSFLRYYFLGFEFNHF